MTNSQFIIEGLNDWQDWNLYGLQSYEIENGKYDRIVELSRQTWNRSLRDDAIIFLKYGVLNPALNSCVYYSE